MKYTEINFDGIVGPTHHFGGYAFGNIASMTHKKVISHPKKAALQGLNKMKKLMDLGVAQAVLPPQLRPSLSVLRALGFEGSDADIIQRAVKEAPELYYQLSSSSFMWTANAATISPSVDTRDGKVHITIANLLNRFHRSIEAEETYRLFRRLFPDEKTFAIHPPLPKGGEFGDEGAANHIRFCKEYGEKGTHLFVYGKSAFEQTAHTFPFRQALEASQAVARQHGLDSVFFLKQNPDLIEKGVFHNDVISTGNRRLFLYHDKAFVKREKVIEALKHRFDLKTYCVTEEMLSVDQAIKTYLFNSQMVTLPDHSDLLVAPLECASLDLSWLPLPVIFIDLSESMQNGGGPACLRLRMVLNEEERQKVHQSLFLSKELYSTLVTWVEKHYREELSLEDLKDPLLFEESKRALESLNQILYLN